MAETFVEKGYHVISNGTDNHSMLIDLRSKNITGKEAEAALGLADITVNKNMVPFDDKSPFVTSGIRVGTPALTTRGLKEDDMVKVVNYMDKVISNPVNEKLISQIKAEINNEMKDKPLFAKTTIN